MRSKIAAIGLCLLSATAAAQPFPSKPVRLVVALPAGSATDVIARTLAVPVGQALGQPIIVENKAGADGAIAGSYVTKAPAEGYTIFLATNSPMSAVPAMRKAPPYDPVSDFTLPPAVKVALLAAMIEILPLRLCTSAWTRTSELEPCAWRRMLPLPPAFV